MELINRLKAPTPRIFKKLRTIGISLVTVGGAIIASPVVLPVGLVTLAGYAMVAGTVMGAVSQVAVDDKRLPSTQNIDHGSSSE